MKNKKKWYEIPFDLRMVPGSKKNLGIFHPMVDKGKKLLGWMDPASAKRYILKNLEKNIK